MAKIQFGNDIVLSIGSGRVEFLGGIGNQLAST